MKKSDRIEVSIAWIQIGFKSESPKNHFLSLIFYYRESYIQPANAYLTQSEYQYERGLYRMPSGSCIIFFLKTTHHDQLNYCQNSVNELAQVIGLLHKCLSNDRQGMAC